MAALDQFPGAMLICAIFRFLLRMPTDGGRVKKNLSALHRSEARPFGIPLIPADQDADFAVACLPGAEAEVARWAIEFLIVERIIRDVHLPVDAEHRPVGIDD